MNNKRPGALGVGDLLHQSQQEKVRVFNVLTDWGRAVPSLQLIDIPTFLNLDILTSLR